MSQVNNKPYVDFPIDRLCTPGRLDQLDISRVRQYADAADATADNISSIPNMSQTVIQELRDDASNLRKDEAILGKPAPCGGALDCFLQFLPGQTGADARARNSAYQDEQKRQMAIYNLSHEVESDYYGSFFDCVSQNRVP